MAPIFAVRALAKEGFSFQRAALFLRWGTGILLLLQNLSHVLCLGIFDG